MSNKATTMTLALCTALIFAAVAAPTVSATGGGVHFYLNSDNTFSDPADGNGGSVAIGANVAFLGPEALVDVTFTTADAFTATIVLDANARNALGEGGSVTVELGNHDLTTCTGSSSPATLTSADGMTWTGAVSPGTDIVLTGQSSQGLCVLVTVENADETLVIPGGSANNIDTNAASFLETPSASPGYPTPSVATIVLLSLGALMVAGVVYVRKNA